MRRQARAGMMQQACKWEHLVFVLSLQDKWPVNRLQSEMNSKSAEPRDFEVGVKWLLPFCLAHVFGDIQTRLIVEFPSSACAPVSHQLPKALNTPKAAAQQGWHLDDAAADAEHARHQARQAADRGIDDDISSCPGHLQEHRGR